jgi:hypothetical protein
MSVYVIECAGLLKIGYSEDPERRTAKLFQSASRYSAPRAAYEARGTQRLVHVIERATKNDEALIHRALDDFAIGAEWFVNEPPVLALVRSFAPDDIPEPVVRDGGTAWDATPDGDRGGRNLEPNLAIWNKRRAEAGAA